MAAAAAAADLSIIPVQFNRKSMAAADPSIIPVQFNPQSTAAAAAAADPSINRSINQYAVEVVKEEEADPSPRRQSLNSIDQSMSPSRRSPSIRPSMVRVTDLHPNDLPHRPCLWTLSGDGTTLIAIDCLSDDDAPRFYCFRLPDHLHGRRRLYSSVGHFLHLEEYDFDLLEKEEDIASLTGVRLFDPFNWTEFPPLPPSASIEPGSDVVLHTVVLDVKRGIALALVDSFDFRLVYTSLDEARRGVDPVTRKHRGIWTNLNHLLSGYFISGCDIYLRAAILHQDGLFYAVDCTGNKVFSLDFSIPGRPTLSDVTSNLPNNLDLDTSHDVKGWCCYQSASLVNSGPSVFLVRWRNTLRKGGANVPREIDVFRLEVGLKRWVPMKSLGNQSFFIGSNSSFSLSIEDFPELKSNRVYICRDAFTPISGNQFSCPYGRRNSFRHHLLCNLEDESWGEFFDKSGIPEDFPSMSLASVWMLPPTGASTLG